jgi:peptidoglycan hydrolase-like protein with peptidoglycan-binding domain
MICKTTRQIMFYQLGYYDNAFDGIWGKGSIAATKQFQKDYGLEVDGIYGKNTDKKLKSVHKKAMAGLMTAEDWKKIKNFKQSEIDCTCGCGYKKVYKQAIWNLQAMRHHLGVSIKVTSGGRCKKKNKAVGGATGSRHYNYGLGIKAFDWTSSLTKTLDQRKEVIDFWVNYMPGARYSYCNGYGNKNGKKSKPVANGMNKAVHSDIK